MKTFQSFKVLRKTSALLLICVLMLSLSGCGRNNTSTTTPQESTVASSEADSSAFNSGDTSTTEMSADSSESTTKNDMFDGTVGDNGVIGDALYDMETAVSEIGNDIEDSFRESTSAQARGSCLDIRVHKKVMPDA